jgi:phage-related protein
MVDHRSRIGPYTASFRRQWRLFRTSAGSDVVNREMNALESDQATLRALFAKQGRYGQVLLVLHVFKKKTRETPPRLIALAEQRLRDWTIRGRPSHQRDN